MKSTLSHAASAAALLCLVVATLTLTASANDVVLPAGTILQCTMNEPNFSSATADIGDPVLCHLRSITEFGRQAFPRGTYLVGHLESAQDPGHFWGKGNLKIQFDRIGLPTGDLPLEAKIIATRGYKIDKQGDIKGKGHAKRDVVEWMLPPLWPWKVIMLPARGPRPALKGESVLSLRLMDDVQIPQTAQTYGPGWHSFDRFRNSSYEGASNLRPQLTARAVAPVDDLSAGVPQATYATYVTRDTVTNANIPASPGMPIFVLNSGMVLAVSGYGYQESRITYSLVGGGSGVISTDDVDWTTTTRVNNQRGVHLALHSGHQNAGSPGL